MKRFSIISICLLLSLGAFVVISKKSDDNSAPSDLKCADTFFVSIPITQFSSTLAPCIEVSIEDRIHTAMLDLGFCGYLSLTDKLVEEIHSKIFIGTKAMHHATGIATEIPLYEIPSIKIQQATFFNPIIQKRCQKSFFDNIFPKDRKILRPPQTAHLGWKTFIRSNLLLDPTNHSLAFSDSLDTLKKNGYPITNFIETSLYINRGLVEVDVMLDKTKILRCMLDTGSTFNIINKELSDGQTFQQAIWDPTNQEQFDSCQIGEREFGSIHFRRLPIRLPIHVDAILGMEFFQNHLVFLDFANRKAYFMKTDSPTCSQ